MSLKLLSHVEIVLNKWRELNIHLGLTHYVRQTITLNCYQQHTFNKQANQLTEITPTPD